ncbi:hypothetical protein EV426DRAFT_571277 [Tirmania nivea]|nr:hypothetical protein EV426DRAFT_571277 [Tirmania nivea]
MYEGVVPTRLVGHTGPTEGNKLKGRTLVIFNTYLHVLKRRSYLTRYLLIWVPTSQPDYISTRLHLNQTTSQPDYISTRLHLNQTTSQPDYISTRLHLNQTTSQPDYISTRLHLNQTTSQLSKAFEVEFALSGK